jgi:hypothetical protein
MGVGAEFNAVDSGTGSSSCRAIFQKYPFKQRSHISFMTGLSENEKKK